MDLPEPFEDHFLSDGERKIVRTMDTKVMNAARYKIIKEDYTIACMIRDQLLKDPNVIFAGYKIPHPLQLEVDIRIQTTPESTPNIALKSAITDLISELALIEEQFKAGVRIKTEKKLMEMDF